MKNLIVFIVSILLLVLTYNGCDSTNAPDSGVNVGNLQIKITDAPFPFDLVEEANITIEQIELRRKNDSGEDSYEVLYLDPTTLNLIKLRNGETEDLSNILIGIGTFDLVRLIISEAKIKFYDSEPYDLNIPSGTQTGIKLFIDPPLEIVAANSSELLLDFDLGKSFHSQGNPNSPNSYIFTPVVRAVNMLNAGSVYGTITDQDLEPIEGVEVIAENNGKEYSTYSNPNGSYEIMGLPVGPCSVTAKYYGFTSGFVSNIDVVTENKSELNFVLFPN